MTGKSTACVIALAACVLAAAIAQAASGQTTPSKNPLSGVLSDPELAQWDYVEQCAGCHGVQGKSAPADLPELRDRVGYFMCTPETRAYLIRLPNIAHSRISDNAQLADMLNFVVFGLGGTSAPKGTRPFTGEEVARERKLALVSGSLKSERAKHVDAAIRGCGAPASLRAMYVSDPNTVKK
jgi:hypothetical protein